jgi:hypothetical protein
MNYETWKNLTLAEKANLINNSALTKQLLGLEGWRVEVITTYGEKRRFIVGKSTGWKPSHLEVSRRNALGGFSAEKEYSSVKKLYFAR